MTHNQVQIPLDLFEETMKERSSGREAQIIQEIYFFLCKSCLCTASYLDIRKERVTHCPVCNMGSMQLMMAFNKPGQKLMLRRQ